MRAAGEWLNAHTPGPKTVADSVTTLAFHATAAYVPLPYSDSNVAIRYLEKRGVNFVVVSDQGREQSPRPYLKEWIEEGVPHPRAKLIYRVEGKDAGRIRIYDVRHTLSNEPHEEKADAHR